MISMNNKPAKLNSKGQLYRDFLVTKAIEIPELDCFLRELVHLPTQAQIIHIANDDPENVFCLSFQTVPTISNGVAHVLEHTVLCGSTKFPIKDPFFAMQRRSLNTFMNAFTGPDFTCYPAASQVHKDFYNLLEVYLDAVFHPILNELSFLQEGHRLEFADPSNPDSALEFKGIVFNEMKGALSSPQARMYEEINHALFPNVTYGCNSGGDPKVIPTLTYAELKRFHESYYHPSRCLFYFYGNMPLEDHLDFIAKQTLDHLSPISPLEPIPFQTRYKEPVKVEKTYPISPEEDLQDKTMVSFGWLTCPIEEQQEILALQVLALILMDNDASPLKMALMRSGLCKQAGAHMETDINEVPILFAMNGCKRESADQLESLIRTILKKMIKEGVPLALFENAIHQLEFHKSEIVGDHSPFGLSLFMRAGLLKQHQVKPEDGLMIHSFAEQLRQRTLEAPDYLTGLIQKHFLDNPHFVRVVMHPDKELLAREQADEQAALEKIRKQLQTKDVQEIVKKAKELTEFQKKQQEENLDILPKVTKEDIPKYPRDYPLSQEQAGNLSIFHHACFTNDIVYADLAFHMPEIPEEDLSLIRLFSDLLSQMGCGGRSYAENLEYIQAHTGGVSASMTFNLQAKDSEHFFPAFCIRGKALRRKTKKMMTLLHEMATSVDFKDIPRLKEVLNKHFSGLQSTLIQSSLKYAIGLSARGLDVSSRVASSWYGLDYFYYLKDLTENLDAKVGPLIQKLEHYQSVLLCLDDPHLIISSDASAYEEMKSQAFYGLQHIETKPFKPWKGEYALTPAENQGRVTASPVAFTALVFKTIPYAHPDSPALLAASHLFDNLTLHTLLREQGGAYGGGANANTMSGNFYFYSYRDPNIGSTLEAFDKAVRQVANGEFDESDLEEAILEIIQDFDSPVAPGSRADLAYGWLREGKPIETRQVYRDRLLSLTPKQVIQAVKSHIIPQLSHGSVVSFAGRELLEKENALLKAQGRKPLKIEKI